MTPTQDAIETFTYEGRIQRQPQGKNGSRGVLCFITITHPQWTDGVDSIGASTWLHPNNTPAWLASKRENLKQTLLQHAEENALNTNGLDAYLTTFLEGVQP